MLYCLHLLKPTPLIYLSNKEFNEFNEKVSAKKLNDIKHILLKKGVEYKEEQTCTIGDFSSRGK